MAKFNTSFKEGVALTLYELIKDGFDRNILVYDIDSKGGRLTKRLICLLIGHAQINEIEPEKIFIDANQIPEVMNFLPYTEDWPKLGPGRSYTLYGIEVEFITGLDVASGEGKPYLDFYLKMGGSTMSYRKSLIVLAGKDKAILGCY